MPGWHERTQELQAAGQLRMVGIVEEQHPDRARLFMQWKQMDWPLLVDALNRFEVTAVPITLLIDEAGIIRALSPKPADLEAFLNRPPPSEPIQPARSISAAPGDIPTLTRSVEAGDAEAIRPLAEALFLWEGPEKLDQVIAGYDRILKANPDDGPNHFRLGVAFRRRYDSEFRRDDDFSRAIEQWGLALDLDPNQYIWRRRIQQYGPRLDKPYPFYDWVNEARRDIRARGETPAPLVVDPSGAEIAAPSQEISTTEVVPAEPDPMNRITRDREGFIRIEKTVVPSSTSPHRAWRIHLVFRPNPTIKAHWNNEVDGLAVWLRPPKGWTVDSRFHSLPNPPEAATLEPRAVEFELRAPADAQPGEATLAGYALYYVCEDANGTCVYRRLDFSIPIPLGSG